MYELIGLLIIAIEENYMEQEEYLAKKEHINKCLALLNGYINCLIKPRFLAKKKKSNTISLLIKKCYWSSEWRLTNND